MLGDIKFISYDGKFPNLCSGRLVLSVDCIPYTFGYRPYDYEPFWSSGGSCGFYNNYEDSYITYGKWTINAGRLPEELKQYANEIIELFNSNVPYGCCGGCL